MSNAKRGFVFYFDLCPMVDALPPDQRGWLLSALCAYADRVWRDPAIAPEEIEELYPQCSPQTQMAFRFLASVILRDTKKWLDRRDALSQRRTQRGQAPAATPAGKESAAALERSRQEFSYLSKVVEQIHRDNEAEAAGQVTPAGRSEAAPGPTESPLFPRGR